MADLSPRRGTLYVVATPIGNLEDITLRAVRILGQVALVASEDTRHTRKLLSHLHIRTPLVSYFKGKEASRAEPILSRLLAGDDVALVSDAGTPGISDPGAMLVRKARESNIPVVPVPGPSALAAAVSVAGFESTAFLFLGFLPSRPAERRKFLKAMSAAPSLLAFYESPLRIVAALKDCLAVLGDRRLVAARELTKLHEEILAGTVSEVLAELAARERVKGELVVIIEGSGPEQQPEAADLDSLIVWYRDQSGLSLRDAVQRIAQDLGLKRSAIYQEALRLWEEQ
ncbi:MAG: 16S rRNA (cytidine(1402)-2'-O)-methyltransferase [Desulfobulbaceae bacterium]|nr:16S rRNA (cytidine(1402)-2'-O)-methyltransferase [Desulfobulbaceae bacterium]